jgi:hypothetical protein
MNHRSWLNIGLFVAVVALGLIAWLKPQKIAPEHKLSTLTAGEANRVRIESPGAEPIIVERKAGAWKLAKPIVAPADDFQIQRLLTLLEATARERLPATDLARYELVEPPVRVIVNEQTFGFGSINPVSREQYVLTEDAVYLVHARYGSAVPGSALQLVSKQLFTSDEVPVAFELPQFSLVQVDGRWRRTPAVRDPSADDTQRWVDEWRHAAALSLALASGRKSRATINVKLASGASVVLDILQSDPELILARGDRKLEYRFSASTAKRLLAPPGTAKDAKASKPRANPHERK